MIINKTINNIDIIINITSEPFYNNSSEYFFGFPIHKNLKNVNNTNIHLSLNDIKGYFLYIGCEEDNLIIANDLLAGFRTYIHRSTNKIFISDDFNFIIDACGNSKFDIDKNEMHFYQKHRFTSGGRTFFKNLDKFEPATLLVINKTGIKSSSYFKDFIPKPSSSKHKKLCKIDLLDSLTQIKQFDHPKVLMFSGGRDSTLLALMMKELKIEFTPVFFTQTPAYLENARDLYRARIICRQLNLKLEEIIIDFNEGLGHIDKIIDTMLFDRHYSILHYIGMRKIHDKFGSNTIVINGQSSDNVLSFGPSDKTIGNFLRRLLLYYGENKLLTYPINMLFQKKFKTYYTHPQTENEKLLAFYDESNYIFLLNNEDNSYFNYLINLLSEKTRHLNTYRSKTMFLKIYGYLQGSDNQIVIKSGIKSNCTNTFMPFSSPAFIYATMELKNNFKELIKPKYVIDELIDGYKFKKINNKTNYNSYIKSAEYYEDIINKKFEYYINKL